MDQNRRWKLNPTQNDVVRATVDGTELARLTKGVHVTTAGVCFFVTVLRHPSHVLMPASQTAYTTIAQHIRSRPAWNRSSKRTITLKFTHHVLVTVVAELLR